MIATLRPGEIVIAFPRKWDGRKSERVLVEHVEGDLATCALVSLLLDTSTHLDPILPPASTSLAYYVVVHSFAVARIDLARLSAPVGRVGREVLDEVGACRRGDPGDEYQHGEYLLPGVDPRETLIVEMVRAFRDQYGPGAPPTS